MIKEIMHKNSHYANVIVGLCFSIQAIGVGTYISYGVFFNPLMAEFGWSRFGIAGVSSAAFVVSGIFGILIGRLNDKFGPRKLMAITAVFLGTGYSLMYTVTEIWQLYLFLGLIFGIGLSAIDVIPLTTIARWFPHNRGIMTGIAKVGTGAGQLCLPLLASILILNYGWRNAFLIMGLLASITLIIISGLLKRDPGDNTSRNQKRQQKAVESEIHLTFSQSLHSVQFWIICLVNMSIVYCLLTIMVHIVPHAIDLGIQQQYAASVLSIIGAVSMAGRFITGIAIDRIKSKKMMVICLLILMLSILLLQTADCLWKLYFFACLYGFAHGGLFTAISPIIAEFFGISFHGSLFGIVVFFGTAGGAVGPIVAGQIYDVTGSYTLAFKIISVIIIVSFALLQSLKPVAR